MTTDLDKDDFDNLSDEIDGIVDEIKAAAKAGEKGVTILLIGEEGVGKTEMAKVLAKRAGKRLVSVSEDSDEATEEFDEDGNLVSTITYDAYDVRKADLKQANKLFEGNKDVILFFDEAEDLMPPSQDSEKSSDPNNKIATNRLIEENPIVTIMAVNDPRKFHRSFLDRFQAKLFIDTPPTLARQSIWKSQAEKVGVKLSDEDTLYLARNYEIAPRKIVMPLKAAARQPGKDALKVIENRLAGNAVNVSRIKAANPIPRDFSTDLYEAESPDTVDDKTRHLIDLAKRNYPFSLFMTVGEGMEEEALLTYIAEQAKLNIDIVEADELMVETAFSNPLSNISNLFTSASNYKRMVGITNIHALAEYAGNQKEWQESPVVQHFMREASRHNQPFAIVGSRKFASDVASAKFRAMFSESMTLTDIDTARLPSIYQRVLGVPLPDGIAFSEQDETKIRLSDLYAAKTLMRRMADTQDPHHVYDLVMRQKQAREKTSAGQIGFSAQPS